jgi:hypothetical protein
LTNSATAGHSISRKQIPEVILCAERTRLQEDFLEAIHELNSLQSHQVAAVIDGNTDACRFELLISLAQERKEQAKYAWIAHIEAHRCGEI